MVKEQEEPDLCRIGEEESINRLGSDISKDEKIIAITKNKRDQFLMN